MSNENEIYCSNCKTKSEQCLMLYCEHNLCMKCAAENLIRNESSGINKIQYIICDICHRKTEISAKTSKEVLSLGLNNLNKTNLINNINTNINDINNKTFPFLDNSNSDPQNNIIFKVSNNLLNSNINFFPNVNLNNNSFSRLNINNIKQNSDNNNICREHGEPITYLCLECMSKSICTECVINGFHRNHEVLNIKKAYPFIYDKTHEIANYIDNKIKEFESKEQNVEQKMKDIIFLNDKYKNNINQSFNELRNILNKKEKEIISKTENTLNDILNNLNTYINFIQNKIKILNKIIEPINANLIQKDEISLINFYNENKNKILSQIDTNNIEDINNIGLERIPGLDFEIIDKNSFDGVISALNSLNVELSTFKGINYENQYNLGKLSHRNIYENSYLNENNNIFGLKESNINDSSKNNIFEEIND